MLGLRGLVATPLNLRKELPMVCAGIDVSKGYLDLAYGLTWPPYWPTAPPGP